MTDKEFVDWLRGFTEGVHHYNITPAQWDLLKEKLAEVKPVEDLKNIYQPTPGWVMNTTW